jgi:hypothetical protein
MGDAAIFAISAAVILASLAIVAIIVLLKDDIRGWMRRTIRVAPGGASCEQQAVAAAADKAEVDPGPIRLCVLRQHENVDHEANARD